MFKQLIRTIALLAFILGAIAAGSIYFGATHWRSQNATDVEIIQGSSAQKIGLQLAEKGVIRTPKLFEIIVRIKGLGGRLRAGVYEFEAGTNLMSAIGKLERGEVRQYPFTVVEGWTINDIAASLAGQQFNNFPNSGKEFIRLANDQKLEGYLFPDTYYVTKPIVVSDLIRRLVEKFRAVWASLDKAAIEASNMNQSQIVTLASIVEKETGASEERAIIASVFFNRLKIGMPLQSDPTIIYGLPNFNGNIRKKDITNPHSYNTYVHAGLPPGPICNPGKASLDAVLHPANTDFLYFVSKNDGTHVFSKTGAEHAENVRKYQINLAK